MHCVHRPAQSITRRLAGEKALSQGGCFFSSASAAVLPGTRETSLMDTLVITGRELWDSLHPPHLHLSLLHSPSVSPAPSFVPAVLCTPFWQWWLPYLPPFSLAKWLGPSETSSPLFRCSGVSPCWRLADYGVYCRQIPAYICGVLSTLGFMAAAASSVAYRGFRSASFCIRAGKERERGAHSCAQNNYAKITQFKWKSAPVFTQTNWDLISKMLVCTKMPAGRGCNRWRAVGWKANLGDAYVLRAPLGLPWVGRIWQKRSVQQKILHSARAWDIKPR